VQVWADYKEGQLDPVLEEHLLDSDAHQQARELLLQLLKAKPEARLSIHQVSNSVFFGKGVATLKAISNNLAVGGSLCAVMESLPVAPAVHGSYNMLAEQLWWWSRNSQSVKPLAMTDSPSKHCFASGLLCQLAATSDG
jgi:hypothetical protein